ncbi:MAG: hypothetical protein AAB611_01530 [Patescibacteria group bacterium]
MNKDETYQKILNEAETNPNVIGFVLGAGRGKGFATEYSDYDIAIIVPDQKKSEYEDKYKKYHSTEVIDIGVYSLTEYKNYASWGTEDAAHRYNFTYLKAQVDKTGEIQKIIDEKGVIPLDKVKDFVSKELDGYMNLYYRSMKNHRDGNTLACYLDGVESMFYLLTIVFGVEGRLRPYNKFLEWDLKEHPLKLLPWSPDEFLGKLKKIMATGDNEVQKEIFSKIRELFRREGYGDVIDGWKGYFILDSHQQK